MRYIIYALIALLIAVTLFLFVKVGYSIVDHVFGSTRDVQGAVTGRVHQPDTSTTVFVTTYVNKVPITQPIITGEREAWLLAVDSPSWSGTVKVSADYWARATNGQPVSVTIKRGGISKKIVSAELNTF